MAFDITELVASLGAYNRTYAEQLYSKLIAKEYDISPRTIEVYRANVMTKMQAGSLSELVRLAMRAGALKD